MSGSCDHPLPRAASPGPTRPACARPAHRSSEAPRARSSPSSRPLRDKEGRLDDACGWGPTAPCLPLARGWGCESCHSLRAAVTVFRGFLFLAVNGTGTSLGAVARWQVLRPGLGVPHRAFPSGYPPPPRPPALPLRLSTPPSPRLCPLLGHQPGTKPVCSGHIHGSGAWVGADSDRSQSHPSGFCPHSPQTSKGTGLDPLSKCGTLQSEQAAVLRECVNTDNVGAA